MGIGVQGAGVGADQASGLDCLMSLAFSVLYVAWTVVCMPICLAAVGVGADQAWNRARGGGGCELVALPHGFEELEILNDLKIEIS